MHYSLSDMILDLVQNSIEAGSRLIRLDLNRENNFLTVRLTDDGCGMTEGELEKAKDPFYSDGIKHKHRKVGLGIPFLIQTVEQTDGLFDIHSEKNKGTSLNIRFNLGHYDTPPEGDWPGLFMQTLCFEGDYELIINRMITGENGSESAYTLQRTELQDVLGDFNESGAMLLLRDYLRSQEEDLSV
ncbi:MAG: ATP-binding protein [Spirochaetales bacterium]|nr:ATP-binding protein [Spirochaetales bacterium]